MTSGPADLRRHAHTGRVHHPEPNRHPEPAVDADWRFGAALVIDKVRTGHGRRPFDGTRRILVAVSD